MVAFVLRRVLAALVLLVAVTAAVFATFFLVPRLAGATPDALAARYVGRSANAQVMHDIAVRLGFTEPIWIQYGRFLRGLVAGTTYDTGPAVVECPAPCFGYSFISRSPVLPELLARLPVTVSLAAGAAVIWLVVGVTTGVISALRRDGIFDRVSMVVAFVGVSLPIFFTGMLSLSTLSYWLRLTAPGGAYTPLQENPARWAYDLLLPWLTMAFLYAAEYARLTRAGMLETMSKDFVRTARAKGLPERTIVVKHELRVALTPILTVLGLDLGLLLGGAILTEHTFSLPGIGKYAVDAIVSHDLPKVLGVVLFAGIFIVLANLVVDVLYAVVDPRVRHS